MSRIACLAVLMFLAVPLPLRAQASGDLDVLAEASPRLADQCASNSTGPHLGGVVADLLTEAPRSGIMVAASGEADGRPARDVLSVTDDAGRFLFCDLPWTGPVELDVTDPDGGSSLRSRVSVGPGLTWAGIQYVADVRPSALRGTVTAGSTGAPLANARVEVESLGLATATDQSGTFELRGVAGEITLRVSHPRAATREHTTWLEGGYTYGITVPLAEGGGANPPAITVTRGGQPFEPPADGPARLADGDFGPSHGRASIDWSALLIEPGERVRLTAPGISVGDGIVREAGPRTLTVTENDQEWTLDPAVLRSLELRKSGSLRLGAVIGAIGFGMGALLGGKYILETDTCTEAPPGETVYCTRKPVGAMKFAPVGAAAGAVIGLILGQVVSHWVPVG